MPLCRTSLTLPCLRLEDFPTHLSGRAASELLAAWTALWHPALLAQTGCLPGWHPADAPPDPDALDGELVLVPSACNARLPSGWCDRLRATGPRNPPPVAVAESRAQTIAAALSAASIEPQSVSDAVARDFLALGYAYLQVELVTRAMHYATVLDSVQFSGAVIEAAGAATAGDDEKARDELARAFDLLMDARNHVYSVDFYVVDVTLLAASTLGESLRKKLATGFPTNVLATGDLIEQMAVEHPSSLAELRRALDVGTACIFGGLMHDRPVGGQSPETILADLLAGREAAQRHLGRVPQVFGQFGAAFSPLLPEILNNCGFEAALHVAFDGGPFPIAPQRKSRWGPHGGARIDAMSAKPLDIARPETWLKLADRIADSITHDHVATILLAGWPGQGGEFYGDLHRAAAYGNVLGKPVTLDEYFRITREVDDWSTFYPSEYPATTPREGQINVLSTRVDEYRRAVADTHQQLTDGLIDIAQPNKPTDSLATQPVLINPWNFSCVAYRGVDPLSSATADTSKLLGMSEIPGCGFVTLDKTSVPAPSSSLAEGLSLRNEYVEVVVHEKSGGIQSLKTHGDRGTRASQRLIMHDERIARRFADSDRDLDDSPRLETQMLADRIEVTHSNELVGEITSHGRLLDAAGDLLANFVQAMRVVRRLPAVIVDVELDVARHPVGDVWESYFASRLAWRGDALSVRRGAEWLGRETQRTRIESPEWVEVADGDGTVTCFGLGLPYHRLASPSWLDTVLAATGEQRRRFQFALGLDCAYPSQTALSLICCGDPLPTDWYGQLGAPSGWFLHASAKNTIITHASRMSGEETGVRLRILETEGRRARTKIAAYRPFCSAASTDFLSNRAGVLSVIDGQVQLDIEPHSLVQIEAKWRADSC